MLLLLITICIIRNLVMVDMALDHRLLVYLPHMVLACLKVEYQQHQLHMEVILHIMLCQLPQRLTIPVVITMGLYATLRLLFSHMDPNMHLVLVIVLPMVVGQVLLIRILDTVRITL